MQVFLLFSNQILGVVAKVSDGEQLFEGGGRLLHLCGRKPVSWREET